MDYLKSALSSILHNKGRSLLTMLGIIIGISSVITILAIGNGMKQTVGGELDDMQSGGVTINIDAKKTDKYLTGEEVKQIGEQIPEAYGASPTISGYGQAQAKNDVSATLSGGNENIIHSQTEKVVDGRFFSDMDVQSANPVCVMTQAGAILLFRSMDAVGMTFDMSMNGMTKTITVIGLIGSDEESIKYSWSAVNADEIWEYVNVYVPYTLLTQGYSLPGANIQSFTVYPEPGRQDDVALKAKRLAENMLGLRGQNAVSIQSFASMLESFNKILNIVTTVVTMIAAISLIVGGIGVMNIMTVSVTERTREIGIRKALGARTGSILIQFLAESAMLTLIGGIIGMLAGYGLTFIVSRFMSFPPRILLSDVALVVLISTSIGIFFGIYPALRAAKMDPIEALRYE